MRAQNTQSPQGTKKWEFKTGEWVVSSPAIGSDSTVYVGSNDKKLYAITAPVPGAIQQQQVPPQQQTPPQQQSFRTFQPGTPGPVSNRTTTQNMNQIVNTRLGLRQSNKSIPGASSKPSPTRGFPLNRAPASRPTTTGSVRLFRPTIFRSSGRANSSGRPGRRR